jgi:NDP-sugar pyrophosphorylase family protein
VSLPVAILAGGLATRLRPLTERVPKILLDIAGRPFAEHQVELLKRGGISRVVYCLGYLGEQVRDALGDGSRWQMTFSYVFDGERLLGTGGALRRALPQLGDAFFVMYGDSYLECDLAEIEGSFRASGKAGLMTVFRNDNRWDRSNVRYEGGHILRYDKRASDPAMHHIDYGLGILTPGAFAAVDDSGRVAGAPLDLAVVYQQLIATDSLAGYEVQERFYEIGSHEGLEELRTKLEARARMTQ